ncbi:MAG: group 1 glycosyl transferase, partial [Chloroflexi bacterium]|nr:group 1 glycosyl transferase [Chloroflexota bacterium]
MRVLHIYHDFAPTRGGIEDYLAELTRAQVARGMQVTVLCANHRPQTRTLLADGVRVIRAASLARCFTPVCPTWPVW